MTFRSTLLIGRALTTALLLLLPFAPAARAQEGRDGADGVRRLAERWLGERAGEVTLELRGGAPGEGHDAFTILAVDGATHLYGSSRVALARGLFEYLRRDVARLPSWWSGPALPPGNGPGDALPPATAAKGGSPYALRTYLTPEAFAYGAAFWDAPRWEREVDLAALRGLNAMLMPLGRDRVMVEVYRRLGLEPEVYTDWSVGSAFRAFGWSGEAVGWMGPQSLTFAEADVAIARRAIARMRDLGVEPILPAFTGVLPAGFAAAFPEALTHPAPEWAGLGASVLLDPDDPLFARVAELYYEELAARVGTSTLYQGAPFGEERPPLTAPEDLARLARGVSSALALARPGARWIVSAWPLRFDRGFWSDERVRAFVSAVPTEQLVVLDRVASVDPVWDRTEAFFGHAFLWGTTPSFGGRQRLGGRVRRVAGELARARERQELAGVTVAHECPGVDPLQFDLICDQLWSADPIDPDAWVEGWVRARYGTSDPRAVRAWRRVLATAYAVEGVDAGPSAVASAPGTLPPPPVPYDLAELVEAWRELIALAEDTTPRPALRHDVVNLGRQVLSDAAVEPIASALEAFAAGDAEALARQSARALSITSDLDELLATHPAFLLGAWLESAAARAGDEVERASIVAGARALVTHFGPIGSPLRDWGGREWAGLVGAFHRERWRRLFEALSTSLATGAGFDASTFDAELAAFEREWAARANPYSAVPMGDWLAVARRLVDAWGPELAPGLDALAPGTALVTERTAPLGRWRLSEGEPVGGTRLVAELEFLAWLRETYGVTFDLVEWRALGWDADQGYGAREAVVSNLGASPQAVRALAQRAGTRLALVGGTDGFGDDAASERARRRQLEAVAADLFLGALVLDGRLGPPRDDGRDALGRALLAARERVPDLLFVARAFAPGELEPLLAVRGEAGGPWLAAAQGPTLYAHGPDLARGRAESRLLEVAPVVVDGRPGWDDALVWQAFGLAPVVGLDVGGAPWLLEDRDLVRFVRLVDLFRRHRELLAGSPSIASTALASGAVARGDSRRQVVVVRNLTFETVRVDLPVGPALGLDAALAYEARQWHPTERYLGSVPSGDTLPIEVEPFRCTLVALSADGFDEPVLEGCDQLWVPAGEGAARSVVLFGSPGGEARVRLRGRAGSATRATVDGVGVDAVLSGAELRLRFPAEGSVPAAPRPLGALESTELPTTADELVRAARASIVSTSTFALLSARPTSGFAAVERARRLALADLERLDAGAATASVLQGAPVGARRLRTTLPESLGPGARIVVAVEWSGTPGRLAVAARVPGRGLVGARERFGPAQAPSHAVELRPEDAGRELDLWVLDDGGEGGSVQRARAWLLPGGGVRPARTLVLD